MYGNVHILTKKSVILPERLLQYAQYLADDKSHKEIAEIFKVKICSVEAYSLRYRRLLGVKNKTGLVALLIREKLIQ